MPADVTPIVSSASQTSQTQHILHDSIIVGVFLSFNKIEVVDKGHKHKSIQLKITCQFQSILMVLVQSC